MYKTIKSTDIVKEASEWIGTPFHHQARRKGIGCDCVGLIVGVLTSLGLTVKDYNAYSSKGDPEMLLKKLKEHAEEVPLDGIKPGDIIVFKILKRPVHTAFWTGDGIIHAYSAARKVVKHELNPKWARRIYKVFRVRGAND